MKLTREQLAINRVVLPHEKRSAALRALGEERLRRMVDVRSLRERIDTLQMQISTAQASLEYLQEKLPGAEEAYEMAFKTYLAMKKKDLEENR